MARAQLAPAAGPGGGGLSRGLAASQQQAWELLATTLEPALEAVWQAGILDCSRSG